MTPSASDRATPPARRAPAEGHPLTDAVQPPWGPW